MKSALWIVVLLLIVGVAVGCRDGDGSNNENNLHGADGGVCDKDREALLRLLATPEECAATETCPVGSHCDLVSGQCNWQCIANSDCGTGMTCTCDGVCVGSDGDGGVPDGSAADPSCPRDRALLLSIETSARTCILDEDCPVGSACDAASGVCNYACLGTNDPILPCATGSVCDCTGQCVPPGGATTTADEGRYHVTLTPPRLEVPGTSWSARSFQIELSTASAAAGASPPPSVHVRAPAGLRVGNTASQLQQELTISAWNIQLEAGRAVARATVFVAPVSGLDPYRAPWAIEIVGGDLVTVRRTLLVAPVWSTSTPTTGVFRGEVVAEQGTAAGLTRIPVTAWANASFVLFFDESRALSPSGRLGVHLTGSTTPDLPFVTSANGSAMTGRLQLTTLPNRNAAGDLTNGRFTVRIPLLVNETLPVRFDLARTGNLPTAPGCTADGQCGGGYCEESLGLCVEGADWRSPLSANALVTSKGDEWSAASQWMLSSSTPGVFGYPYVPGPRGIGYSLMCFPTGSRTYNAGVSYVPGFRHKAGQSSAEVSGELVGLDTCAQPYPLALGRDLAIGGAPIDLAGDDLLAACLDEVEAPPVSLTGANDASARANRWFAAAAQCASPARFYPHWAWLTQGPQRHRGGVEARLLGHAINRWMGVASFVGQQALEQRDLSRSLASSDSPAAEADLARSISNYESALDLVLASRTADALGSLPRDILRRPDYRDVRPVSYYTFDAADMNGQVALDVVGEAHIVFPSVPARSGEAITTSVEQTVGINRGPAELYGDLVIGMWLTVPTITNGQKKVVVEYGDASNLLYQFYFLGNASNQPVLYAYHGSRWSSVGAVQIGLPMTSGQQIHLLVSRSAIHDVNAGGGITWRSEYRSLVNGVLQMVNVSSNPLVVSLAPSSSAGLVGFRGLLDELVFWDESIDAWFTGASFQDRSRDNALLDTFRAQLAIPTDGDHVQPDSVAPVLLETTASYLRAVEVDLRGRHGAVQAECANPSASSARTRSLEQHGRAMRYAWATEALAVRLQERATTVGCGLVTNNCASGQICNTSITGEPICLANGTPATVSVSWQTRFDRARQELDAARASLRSAVEPIVSCEDAFGLSRSALPLFFGDVVGNNSRFFAASDYLLGTWAAPAVTQAEASLEAVRTAWLSKRSSEIQQLMSVHERAARLEQLELSYAQPIAELCGLTTTDPLDLLDRFAAGTLTADSCYQVAASGCSTPSGREDARCYRGELGKAVLAIFAAKRDVDVARGNAEATEQRYEAASAFCSDEQVRAAEDADAIIKHGERMRALRSKRLAAGSIAGFLGGLAQSITTSNPLHLFSAQAEAIASAYDLQIQNAESDFQAHMQLRSLDTSIRRCFFEADQQKFGIDVSYREVQRRLVDVQLSLAHVDVMKDRVRMLVADGRAALEREQARQVPSLAHHYWVDDRIERYQREFAWARRLTFLALRAIEYEFQYSLSLDDDVLRSGSPAELRRVILELQQAQAGRTINGRRPEDGGVVLSVRDDVLEIDDRSTAPPGERAWSAARRFGEQLRSPRYAVYDDRGDYLGQGIPFTLRERGALVHRCAERLWRVNATIQGDVVEEVRPSVPLIVLKRNTFNSQWCDGRGDGSQYQVGSIRPTTELFRPDGTLGDSGESEGYSSALISPWFNVMRSELYRDAYVDGSSEELAGRGLYGEYILLFPNSGLLEWTDSDPTNDFPLHRIEDVLVRFDFLSVDDVAL